MFSKEDAERFGVSQSAGVVTIASADKQWTGNYAMDIDNIPFEHFRYNRWAEK